MRVPVTTVTVLLALLLSGCELFLFPPARMIVLDNRLKEEMRDVLKSKEQGTARVYDVTPDQARQIARAVFLWEDADPVEQDNSGGYILTFKRIFLFAEGGTVMAAWIDQTDDGTKVTVVKRRIERKEKVAFSETIFHRRFAQAVEIIKKGEDLPNRPPN